jgi:acyl carrier protein
MIETKVLSVLYNYLPEAPPEESLLPDDTLVELGIDSLKLVELILGLEESFQIVIPDDDIVAANFDTVGSVSLLVSRILSGGNPPA